jgi:CubicO group peptidase (beta-lactamase class C family)
MRRRGFLQALALAPLASCARIGAARRSENARPDLFRDLAALVPRLMAEVDVPGVSIACVQGGTLAWARGFGVKNSLSKTPVDNETLFEAASVSKTVFAYAALKLCEKGIIDLDAPLSRYTPTRFVEGDARLDKITPRQVLSHSSGLAEWRSSGAPLIRTEPGQAFRYSGEGYYYLQSVITGLTGKVDRSQCAKYEADFEVCATDFDDFMKRHLLRPFGMSLSSYLPGPGWQKRIASGHKSGVDKAGSPIPKGKPRGSDVARYGAVGALNMTAQEYARFLTEVVAPKPADEFRLGTAMHAEMVRPQIPLPKGEEIDGCNAWALGWGVQERAGGNLLVHSGGQSGFRSLALASIERKAGFIVLTNSDNGGRLMYDPPFLEMARQIVMGA